MQRLIKCILVNFGIATLITGCVAEPPSSSSLTHDKYGYYGRNAMPESPGFYAPDHVIVEQQRNQFGRP